MAQPVIYTYHCLCSQLILASTQNLLSATRRGGESLDKAYIVPLPQLPKPTAAGSDDPQISATGGESSLASSGDQRNQHYTIIFNSKLDRKLVVVRRSDGFETRYQHRCGRCELVVGYQLDKAQFEGELSAGRRQDVIYVLPGALTMTQDMMDGKTRQAQAENNL